MARRHYDHDRDWEEEEEDDEGPTRREYRREEKGHHDDLEGRRSSVEESYEGAAGDDHRGRRRNDRSQREDKDMVPDNVRWRQERGSRSSNDRNEAREKEGRSPPSNPPQIRPPPGSPPMSGRGRPAARRRQSSTSGSEGSNEGLYEREEVDMMVTSARSGRGDEDMVYADDDKHQRISKGGSFDDKYGQDDKAIPSHTVASPSRDSHCPNTLAVMQAPVLERATDLIRCYVERDRTGVNRLNPVYRMYLEKTQQVILVATKVTKSPATVLHFFDMTRGTLGSGLTKKGGNYVCKLINPETAEYILVTNETNPREAMAVTFNVNSFYQQVKSGRTPRRASVILPLLDIQNQPKAQKYLGNKGITLADRIRAQEIGDNHLLINKQPTLENGNYRLNFGGRVKLPSVKNFQLVRNDDPDTIFFQFGKVDDSRYSLDFREPFCPVQAFAASLVQFIL